MSLEVSLVWNYWLSQIHHHACRNEIDQHETNKKQTQPRAEVNQYRHKRYGEFQYQGCIFPNNAKIDFYHSHRFSWEKHTKLIYLSHAMVIPSVTERRGMSKSFAVPVSIELHPWYFQDLFIIQWNNFCVSFIFIHQMISILFNVL